MAVVSAVGVLTGLAVGLSSSPAAAATTSFRTFFQTNDHVLAEYSSGNTNLKTTLGMTPATNPAATILTDGTYQVAFQANNHDLTFNHFGGSTLNTHYGMDTTSSPAITGLADGSWIALFQTNTHHLAYYTSAGTFKETTLGMQPGTNPAIAAQPNGKWTATFQANTGTLYTYNSTGSTSNTNAGLDPASSPAIIGLHDGTYVIAAQANNHNLATAHVSGTGQTINVTNLGMYAGTSPAIAVAPNGTDWTIAVQANTAQLFTDNNNGSHSNTNAGLQKGTNPSITALPDGTYEAAAQANTTTLANAHLSNTGQSTNVTTLGMDPTTSPALGTPTPAPAVSTHPASTNFDWAELVLLDGGWAVCGNNITVLTQWMDSEEPASDWYDRNNPLNNGDGSGGGAGLGSYDNLVISAHYVMDNITANPSWYGQIDSDLTACAAPATTAAAIWNSPWASSHYGNGSTWHSGSVPVVAAPASAWGSNPPAVPGS